MRLRFLYGRSGSGKTRYCLQEIKTRIESGAPHPLVLLVPEQFTFQAERELTSVLQAGGIFRIEVLSFQRMSFRIFNEAGGITCPHIHAAGKGMMIYRLLDTMKKDLKVFAGSADRQGFVQALSALITEFKRHNVSPEDLEAARLALKEDDPLQTKTEELQRIYAAFEQTIRERYRDTDDDLKLAADKIPATTLYEGAEIWIDGFAGFTPQEYLVITRLLAKARRVSVSLCTDRLDWQENGEGTDIFYAVKAAYWRLSKNAQEAGIEVEPAVIFAGEPLPRFKDSPELAHLEKNIFAYPFKAYQDETRDLTMFSSGNVYEEIEAAARDMIRLVRDQGLRYKDIAVVVRNLAAYERLIEVIFAEYEIPFFLDRKVDITKHPLVRLILSMLDIFTESWSYETVFSYLKTGLTGIDRDSIDELENYVLACGIRGSTRWMSPQEWAMSPNLIPNEKETAQNADVLREINQNRFQIVEPLQEFRNKTKGKRLAAEICAALYDFLCTIGVPTRIEGYIQRFRQEGELSLANEYAQVWNIVMDLFDQAVEVMGDEAVGIARFAEILKIGFAEYKVGLIPASLDQVLVGSVERSKSPEIKALYILGVNDGVFPSSALEEGILSDQDRTALRQAGIELASDTKTQAFDEQYLVYRALTTAGNYLRLSWPIADQEGRSMRPSMIISRMRKLFPNITETSNITPPDCYSDETEFLAGKSPAFKKMVAMMRRGADGSEAGALWQGVYHWFSSQKDWQNQCQAVRSAFLHKNTAQPVSKERVTSLYGNPAYASVSRLEKYNSCPFAFYVQYGLGAKERKIYRLNPPDIGTFMHAVIEKFSAQVSAGEISWRSMERAWCQERVSAIVDDMLLEMKGAGIAASKRYTALAVRLKRVVTRAVWLIAEHIKRSGFEPLGYELGFGEQEKFPPITIELETGEKINLSGRIDRVDALKTEDGTYLRIVDYKSGSKDFRLSDVYYGLQVQLITYLDALGKNGGMELKQPVLPGGLLYFRIDDPIIREKGKVAEQEMERAIMKQLKMKGLLLADVRLIKEMDHQIEGSSLIIPASIGKGDVIGRFSRVATLGQFDSLRQHVRTLLTGLCEEIMGGNVGIQPYKKKGMTSCRFCSYSAVCQFDTARKENTYKLLFDKKDEDVWKLIDQEGNS